MTNSTPKPGKPVRGSKSGKPIMALFDLLGRSWALGIIWQLAGKTMTFRQLQQSCEMVSPSVLNRRLKELTSSGFLTRNEGGYHLTTMGLELFELVKPFGNWSESWAAGLQADEANR